MQEIALLRMWHDHEGTPCVRLEVDNTFRVLPPMAQAIVLHAALKLCGATVKNIIDANPNEGEAIVDELNGMSLDVDTRRPH